MSADQLSLLDLPPVPPQTWRASDPPTARAAARSVHEAARKAEVLTAMAVLAQRGVRHVTASEVYGVMRERGTRMEIGSVRSRLNQLRLEDPQRVRKTGGVRVVPPPAGTGRHEQLWVLAEAGHAWLVGAVA